MTGYLGGDLAGRRPDAVGGHLAPLDGLRAIAIGLVLLYHLTPGRDSNQGVQAALLKIADLGWSGVDLFFVLSGFLITGKLLAARTEPTPFRSFYTRRALRIFPIYYLTLFAAFVLLPALHSGVPFASMGEQLRYWLYYSNFVGRDIDFGGVVSIGHFWSLAVEEQFYLVWPAVILVGGATRSMWVCGLVFALAPLGRLAGVWGGASWFVTYAWTPLRADGLVVGAMLALLLDRGVSRRNLLRASLLVAASAGPLLLWIAWRDKTGLVFHSLESLEVGVLRVLLPSVLALFFGALLVLALEVPTVARPLSLPALRPIARYSYGIYVFHFMLVSALMRWMPPVALAERLGSANRGALAFCAVGSTLSFILAALSYHGFESYFLTLKPQRRLPKEEAECRN